MADKVDYAVQDCGQLEKTVAAYFEAMAKKGFTEARKQALTSARELVVQKSSAQTNAVKLVEVKTVEQNTAMANSAKIIQQVKDGAKASFETGDARLKLFRIGDQMPTSVKKMRSLFEYMSPVVLEYTGTLLQNGLEQADIDLFHSTYATLVAADTAQENAKKMQKSATISRDDAYVALKKEMSKVRAFANTCFKNNPEILVQFEPIAKGRGGENEDTPPVQPPQ